MSTNSTVRQGEIFWISADALRPSVPGVSHPHVVIQDDALNQSRVPTTIVCGLSSNLKRASEPGNLLLLAGEGNLPGASVVIVSQISTVDKTALGRSVGKLSDERVRQILAGLSFLQKSFWSR